MFGGEVQGGEFARVQFALAVNVGSLFDYAYNVHIQADFVTVDNTLDLWPNPSGSTLTVSSTILNNVGATNGAFLNAVWATNTATSSLFASVGAGSYYLPPESPLRSVQINSFISQHEEGVGGYDLSSLPPEILPASVSQLTLLAPRFDWAEAIGYKYLRLDYLASNVTVTATLQLTNSVHLGLIGAKGFQLNGGAQFISGSSPTAPNRLVRVSLAQEGSTGLTGSTFTMIHSSAGTPRPTVTARHTEFLVPAESSSRRWLLTDGSSALASFSLRNCQVFNAALNLESYNASQVITLHNNLWSGGSVTLKRQYYATQMDATLRHNLFHRGSLTLTYLLDTTSPKPDWIVKDNLFATTLSASSTPRIVASHNGYTNTTAVLGGTGNKTSLVPDFQMPAGGLGRYYYPTTGGSTSLASLLNAGSQSAAAADLWHYTSRSDGVKDGQNDGTKVDIGYHYRALPSDTDGDTLDDLVEDANGNGVVDGAETPWNAADIDGDGMPDNVELWFGSNSALADQDGDGKNDQVEYSEGTDPRNAGAAALLQSWSFSDPSGNPTSTSDAGTAAAAAPVGFNHEGTLYDGPAAKFTTGTTGVLKYAVSGSFALEHGSLVFTYVPQWYDGDASDQPGSECRLFECSEWSLSVSANGRALVFRVPKSGGGTKTAFITSLPRDDGQNLTHRRAFEVELSWTRGGVNCRINGATKLNESVTGVGVGEGGGVEAAPSSSHLVFGSAADGSLRVQGWLDQVQSFNSVRAMPVAGFTPLLPQVHHNELRRQQVFTATAEAGGLKLSWRRGWEGDPAKVPGNYKLERRELPNGAWESVGNFFTHTHLDPVVTSGTSGVREGKYFEYRLHRGSKTAVSSFATWKGALTAHRGQAILVIEDTLANTPASTLGLPAAINSFKADLVAEGWSVREFYAPRMNDYNPASAPNWGYSPNWATLGHAANATWKQNVLSVKTNIYNAWSTNQAGNNVVILLGHVPVPYSGAPNTSEDGHSDNRGAWPADAFYGDMSVFHWPDTVTGGCTTGCDVNYPSPHLANVPGDGKWDNLRLPGEPGGGEGLLELPVGRIDFGRMSYFIWVPNLEFPHDTEPKAEAQLYKRHLAKIAQFRRRQIVFPDNWNAFVYNDSFYEMLDNGRLLASRVYGAETLDVGRFAHAAANDQFLSSQTNLFGLHGGYGSKGAVRGFNYAEHTVVEISGGNFLNDKTPHAGFLTLRGSYFGDWSQDSVLIRTCLAEPVNVLATWWAGYGGGVEKGASGPYQVDALAAGQPLAAMQLATYNRLTNQSVRTSYILGDPTLRSHYGQLPGGVGLSKAFVSGTNRVTVTWTVSPDAPAGHAVFRAPNPTAPVWTWVGTVGAGTNTYLNLNVPNGTHAYQVRGLSLRNTGAGSHTNLTLGVTNHITVP